MTDEIAKDILDKIIRAVFERENPFSLDEFKNQFAFDVFLPRVVQDSETGEATYTDSTHGEKFITEKNSLKRDSERGWMLEKQDLTNLEQILKLWQDLNLVNTERGMDNVDVAKSDTIYRSEKIYNSTNCDDSKNLIFCDSCSKSEYLAASSRSFKTNFAIRTDDSANCSNCFEVQYSSKIANSFFIQDCFDLYECIFCAHIVNKKFCIANIQLTEAEYFAIKPKIIDWILAKQA